METPFSKLQYKLGQFNITPRTFRLYQTKGMVPGPIRRNRKEGAVYDEGAVGVALRAIDFFKKHYKKHAISLEVISGIMKKYNGKADKLCKVLWEVENRYGSREGGCFSPGDNHELEIFVMELGDLEAKLVRASVLGELKKGTPLKAIWDKLKSEAYIKKR